MHVMVNILLIAAVGAVLGLVSIPFGFHLTSSALVVYLGNALGSLFAALVLLYLSDKFIARYFQKKIKQEKIERASVFINKYGVHAYGLLCPLFPGGHRKCTRCNRTQTRYEGLQNPALYRVVSGKRRICIWLLVDSRPLNYRSLSSPSWTSSAYTTRMSKTMIMIDHNG